MKVIRTIAAMQCLALNARKRSEVIAFVPTMGALHEGHLTLVRKAQTLADHIVMSIYVNPTQFGPKEDFRKYPRTLNKDLTMARKAGVDSVWTPDTLYHAHESTWVEETELSHGRCGASRPGHFKGVATVVCKLLHIVQPHIALFGQKDAQQCDVIERMVRDLFIPVRIVRVPTVRDSQGVALSSRNRYLSAREYELVVQFAQTLQRAGRQKNLTLQKLSRWTLAQLCKIRGLHVDYVEWINGFLCAAVWIGKTRLIDNVRYTPIKS